MPESTISNAASIVQLLTVGIAGCLALINTMFFFILGRIKKNIDDLWSKRNADHDDITKIKSKLKID